MAHPPDSDPIECGFFPFALPAFPLSQSAWLAGLVEDFYKRHDRGLAALLILDTQNQQWVPPILPTQRANAGGASFRLLQQDVDHLIPSCRVAGSFQLSVAPTLDEAYSQVPAFDGLHRIYGRKTSAHCECYWFLRVQGQAQQVLPESVLIDDWREYLQFYRSRLTFS
jgi:hypothetical protein